MSDLVKELGEVVAALEPRASGRGNVWWSHRGEAMAASFIARNHATLSALVAERDALRADAERWRYFRLAATEEDGAKRAAIARSPFHEGNSDALDAAIDAARQATPAPDPLISGGAEAAA